MVFDVLRATTTIAVALAAGALEVRAFPSLAAASTAAADFAGPKLLAGERECLRPPGFDVGNSPLEMTPDAVRGRTIFLSTTNGTRALRAAFDHPTLLKDGDAGHSACFAGALVNARATARAVIAQGRDVVLLCSGSDGEVAEEDLLGAGAVLKAIEAEGEKPDFADDAGALEWFERFQQEGELLLARTRGGRKLLGVGMRQDLAACAALDQLAGACRVDEKLRIREI